MTLPDVERVADEVHAAWMDSKRAHGITSRTSETGEELMVPYAQLSEAAKDVDRDCVRAVYAAIDRAGSKAPAERSLDDWTFDRPEKAAG